MKNSKWITFFCFGNSHRSFRLHGNREKQFIKLLVLQCNIQKFSLTKKLVNIRNDTSLQNAPLGLFLVFHSSCEQFIPSRSSEVLPAGPTTAGHVTLFLYTYRILFSCHNDLKRISTLSYTLTGSLLGLHSLERPHGQKRELRSSMPASLGYCFMRQAVWSWRTQQGGDYKWSPGISQHDLCFGYFTSFSPKQLARKKLLNLHMINSVIDSLAFKGNNYDDDGDKDNGASTSTSRDYICLGAAARWCFQSCGNHISNRMQIRRWRLLCYGRFSQLHDVTHIMHKAKRTPR